MALKAKSPDVVVPSKPKFMISGESGVGKTHFALMFPKPYIIDTEKGATRPQYQQMLKASGGAYFGHDEGSQNFLAVIEEVKQLATTKHEYKTLIIDSFSYLYMLEAAAAEIKGGSEFGRDKREANKPTRQLISWLEKCDMTVILICHSKVKWTRQGTQIIDSGTTFDGYDKLEYILDLWIEMQRGGKNMIIRKSRIQSLPQDSMIAVDYSKFADVYGKDLIEKESKPLVLANDEQVARVLYLIDSLKIDGDTIEKWWKKCDVDNFGEMTSEQIQGCIGFMEKKITDLTKEKK